MTEDQKKTIIKNARTFVECQKHDSIEKSCMIGLLSVIDIVKEESVKEKQAYTGLEFINKESVKKLEAENKVLKEEKDQLVFERDSETRWASDYLEQVQKLEAKIDRYEKALKDIRIIVQKDLAAKDDWIRVKIDIALAEDKND